MQETVQCLGFDIGYGWRTPAASKAKPLMDAKVRNEDPKKDSMMYVVSLGPATSTATISRISPTPAPSCSTHQEEYYLAQGPSRITSV